MEFYLKQMRTFFYISLLTNAILLCSDSVADGGANLNEKSSGSGDDGVQLSAGEIAVHNGGTYIFWTQNSLFMQGNLQTSTTKVISEIPTPHRVIFSEASSNLYATNETSFELIAFDFVMGEILWKHDLVDHEIFPRMKISTDDAYVILTYGTTFEVLDSTGGRVIIKEQYSNEIVDFDLTDENNLFITFEHGWVDGKAWTTIEEFDLSTKEHFNYSIPNCADELLISLDRKRAYLAPTTCIEPVSNEPKDPVSVIDLVKREWERNLPGFGPVAINKNRNSIIAFMDADNLDRNLFLKNDPLPNTDDGRFFIMLIEPNTLEFTIIPIGDVLPRYFITPNGKVLLLDEAWLFKAGLVRILDLDSYSFRHLRGPAIQFNNFVITNNSDRLFAIYNPQTFANLYELSIPTARLGRVPLNFQPTGLNLTTDDKLLLLRSGENENIYMLDLATNAILKDFVGGANNE